MNARQSLLLGLVLGAVWGSVAMHAWKAGASPPPENFKEEVPTTPLNGTFQCEYYKSTGQRIEDVGDFEVTPADNGWRWVLHLKDGTSLFFAQGTDKFCYVRHNEE